MLIEEIIDRLGDNFDEVRKSLTEGFVCYLIDGRRFTGKTFRESLEFALKAHEEKNIRLA